MKTRESFLISEGILIIHLFSLFGKLVQADSLSFQLVVRLLFLMWCIFTDTVETVYSIDTGTPEPFIAVKNSFADGALLRWELALSEGSQFWAVHHTAETSPTAGSSYPHT